MIEFTKDLIHRAWLVEDINGEHALVDVEYTDSKANVEKFLAQVKQHEKLENGEYAWFEIGNTYPCTVDGEEAYYIDTIDLRAGDFFELNENGVYTTANDDYTGTATIVDKNAKFYVSHMLQETPYRMVSDFAKIDPAFAKFNAQEKLEQIVHIQNHIRNTTFKDFAENELDRNRIQEQKREDAFMIKNFPEWIPEYTPMY